MFEENELIDNYHCRDMVVVRWESKGVGAMVTPSSPSVLQFVKSVGYILGDMDKIRCAPCPADPEQFLVLPMKSEAEAVRISHDSDTKGFAIDNARVSVNRLIGPNGARLRDVTDCLRLWHEQFDNDDLMNFALGLIRMETGEKQDFLKDAYKLIEAGLRELVENCHCTVFGSASSGVRSNAYSDYDINVVSISAPETPGSHSCRQLQHILDNPKCLVTKPLTKEELASFPPEEVIKVLFKCFNDNQLFKTKFDMRFIPARTPIMVFKTHEKEGMSGSFDISVNNQIGVDKACLLDLFITKDTSKNGRTRKAMSFLVHWAKSNKLINGIYPEEKLETKTGFNSYIINQMFIHFVQVYSNMQLVFPQSNPAERVIEYDFGSIFADYPQFLREFFKYYANFDFTNSAIYGKAEMKKKTVAAAHGVPESPLMMMDPLDITHNISARVTEEAMKQLKGLIRNALLILKQKLFRVSLLLRTNHNAEILMKNKDAHTCMTTNQLPDALSEFASVCSGHQEYLTFQLPDLIQTSAEFMLLLTRILRFDVSPNHEGPSVDNLYNSMGVIFVLHCKSWIGRRTKKRSLKNKRGNTTNLQLDVMCSDAYQYEDEPIAEMRMAMTDMNDSLRKIVYVEMLKGQVADVRDAMHFLIDQFMSNNLMELVQEGIMSIAKIPVQPS